MRKSFKVQAGTVNGPTLSPCPFLFLVLFMSNEMTKDHSLIWQSESERPKHAPKYIIWSGVRKSRNAGAAAAASRCLIQLASLFCVVWSKGQTATSQSCHAPHVLPEDCAYPINLVPFKMSIRH